jgi:hypothetical protein
MELDNRWVVPYNPVLSRTFNAHINIEYCNSVKSIKYICKYVNRKLNRNRKKTNQKCSDNEHNLCTGRLKVPRAVRSVTTRTHPSVPR